MSTYAIRTEYERKVAIRALKSRKLPCTAVFKNGAPRSIEQNKLQRKWINELAEQGDMTREEYRAHCKAYFGVPILIHENESFAADYNRVVAPLPYETKLQLMAVPFDFPVTRLMTSKQHATYLKDIYDHFTAQGFHLTLPRPRG